jgi:feruloyl esterase
MLALPNTTIETAKVDANNADVCRVTAVTTHPPAGDKVRIWVAIPMTNWNGRFMGTGGGGFLGGSEAGVNQPLALGYAGGATDTGHEGGSGSFAMDTTGHLDWQRVRDNAHVGIHEMTVTGKALTQALYGAAPKYSYFNGCSTGGRQGFMEAQRYPDDYNGIVSAAPAINWPKVMMQSIWSTAVMNATSDAVPAGKIRAATAAAVEMCDAIDGVKDGVIEDPVRCRFDPKTLVGKPAGDLGTFTDADADVIQKLWEGPRRWNSDLARAALGRGHDGTRRNQRYAAEAAGIHIHNGLDPLLAAAESAVRCERHHARALRALLGSVA